MAKKKRIEPKLNDEALPEAGALAGSEITPADLRGTLARWKKLVPDFEERIKQASLNKTGNK